MKKDNGFEKIIILILILLAIIFAVSLLVIIIPFFSSNVLFQKIESVSISEYYAVLISFLALAFCIAIATPYFISKNQVKSVVKKYLETDYKEEVDEAVEKISRTDAHLSRIIAFLLLDKQYYYWAIGWAFRSLKRYKNLSCDYLIMYEEFYIFLLRDVILQSLESIMKNPSSDRSLDAFNTDTTTKQSEANRIKVRAIKDYFDFMFEIEVANKKLSYVRNIKKYCDCELSIINERMKDLCNMINVSYTDTKKTLLDDVIELSAYKNTKMENDYIDFIKNRRFYSK